MTDSSSAGGGSAPGTPSQGSPAARPRRWLLVASLALNLFLVGAIGAGIAVRHGPHLFDVGRDRAPRLIGMPSPHKIRAAVPDSARPIVDALFEAHRADMRARIGGLVAARHAVAEAIRAEPFDAAALAATMADLRARQDAVAEGAQGLMAELAGRLDPDSRDRIAALIDVRHGPGRGPEGPERGASAAPDE